MKSAERDGGRTPPPLEILVVEDETAVASAVVLALRRRGHDVALVASAEEALALPTPRVLVCDVALPGMSGLELVERCLERGPAPHVVFLSGLPTLDDCRRAMRLGASEFLSKPLQIEQLVRAVESSRPRPSSDALASASAGGFQRSFVADVDGVERCLRDLLAFLVRREIGPSARARIVSACGEVLDNAQRHAYAGRDGTIEVEARIEEHELSVSIEDRGVGFDRIQVATGAMLAPATSGLARAAALAEDLRVDSAPGRGTRITLTFTCAAVRFDEGGLIDLSELDFLTPGLARRVLRVMRERSCEPLFNLSPALAVTVGRLLAGRAAEQVAQSALWS